MTRSTNSVAVSLVAPVQEHGNADVEDLVAVPQRFHLSSRRPLVVGGVNCAAAKETVKERRAPAGLDIRGVTSNIAGQQVDTLVCQAVLDGVSGHMASTPSEGVCHVQAIVVLLGAQAFGIDGVTPKGVGCHQNRAIPIRQLIATASRNKSVINGCTGNSRMGSRKSNASSGGSYAEPVALVNLFRERVDGVEQHIGINDAHRGRGLLRRRVHRGSTCPTRQPCARHSLPTPLEAAGGDGPGQLWSPFPLPCRH